MLAANSGFDFRGFAAFVMLIAQRRWQAVQQQQQQLLSAGERGCNHDPQQQQQQQQQLWSDSELESLQLAFDLTRAAHVLQQIQQAGAAAAARNAAWCQHHLSKRRAGGSVAAAASVETVGGTSCLGSVSSKPTPGVGSTSACTAELVDEGQQLQDWVFDLNQMVLEAQAAISWLLKRHDADRP
jgi:hypothetical protein